jgi:exodeoxyribonuclease-1
MSTTLYWHDYETWGADPSIDRPSQFAGVRTDEDLNIISDPLMIYCKPPPDILPHPEACLVTGIAPQKALAEGVPEHEFIAAIHRELSQPGTCGAGYNTIRFDDEVTRYTLYRNFYDPYEREWRNGCCRWDIIDMVRLTYALRPEGIEWPMVDGKPSFKLENLTAANGISHTAAHDAYADVDATIQLARLIKTQQPGLYDYVYSYKSKQKLASLVDVRQRKPLLHVSSMFASERGCSALIVPLAMHPVNKNAVIVFDLSQSPQDLIDLDVEDIERRVFTRQDELSDGEVRIPIKLIHLNKCPILATPKLLTEQAAQRLGIDRQKCEEHWQQLLQVDLTSKLQQLYRRQDFPERRDPERQLYGGFINDADKQVMRSVRSAGAQALAEQSFIFQDRRLPEILFRYRARNFPQSLSPKEQSLWREFCRERLLKGDEGCLSLAAMNQRIDELLQDDLPREKRQVLNLLRHYGADLFREVDIRPNACRR